MCCWTLPAGPPCCFSRGLAHSLKREPRGSFAQTIFLAWRAKTAPLCGATGRCALCVIGRLGATASVGDGFSIEVLPRSRAPVNDRGSWCWTSVLLEAFIFQSPESLDIRISSGYQGNRNATAMVRLRRGIMAALWHIHYLSLIHI